MPEQIGNVTIPSSDTSLVFPLPLEYPLVISQEPTVTTHVFNTGDRKITQRFLMGAGTRQFHVSFKTLPKARYQPLVEFFENLGGPYSTFLVNDPATGSQIRCRLADQNISLAMIRDSVASGGDCTLIEVPSTVPSYSISSTVNRFPSSGLNTALLNQIQEIIPVVRIVPQDTSVSPLLISDRKVTIGGSLYQPRLIDWDGISQDIDGSADSATFTLGNADRVFSTLTKTVNLQKSRIEFSLFHVATTTKLDLWAGDVSGWSFDSGTQFKVEAASGLWELRQSYPVRKASRSCWRTPLGEAPGNYSGCPFTGTCDRSWETCGAKNSFGGINANPETVYLGGYGRAQQDNSFTSRSIIDDNLYGKPLPEIWTSLPRQKKIENGVTTWEDGAIPVELSIAAVRDENEFLAGLGVIGDGEITRFGVGHTLNGSLHHGVGTSQPNAGLRLGYGYDPVSTTSPDGFAQFFNLSDLSNTYTDGRAARTSFVELRVQDQEGKQLNPITSYSMTAYISLGNKGYRWGAPGVRTRDTLSNPIWIAVNMLLKARGLLDAPVAVQEAQLDLTACISAASFCDQVINKVVTDTESSTRKRYEFRGVIREEKALKDWIQEVLNTCLGDFTFAFGKFRPILRANSGSVSAFTQGNVIADSLSVAPASPAFNQLDIQFANSELGFINDVVSIAAHDQARLVGSALQPSYTKASMSVAGISTRDEAAVYAATRLKEELGGATLQEMIAARRLAFKTTVLALEVEPGMVCSMGGFSDLPVNETDNGTHEFRVTGWRLNKDFSIEIQGKSCTDSVYDALQGPNPVDVEVPGLPVVSNPTVIPPDVSDVSLLTATEDGLTVVVPVKFKLPDSIGTLSAIKAYVRSPADGTTIKDAGKVSINFDNVVGGYYTISVPVMKNTNEVLTAQIYLVSCSNVYEKSLDLLNTPHSVPFNVALATVGGDVAHPAQPTEDDWVVSVAQYEDDAEGNPKAKVRIVCNTLPAGVEYFKVWCFEGSSAPTSPSQLKDVFNEPVNPSGTTTMDWWIDRYSTERSLWIAVTGSSYTYTQFPDATSDVKHVTVAAVGDAPQVTGFGVSVVLGSPGGVPSGKLKYDFVPPVSPDYHGDRVYRIWCDSSYNPVPGAEWLLVSDFASPYTQSDWWVLPDDEEFWLFQSRSYNHKGVENLTSAPTVHLHVPSSDGVDLSKAQSGSLTGDKIAPSTITAEKIESVNAGSILGTITAGQIGSVNSGSIVGTITAGQIGSVNSTAILGTINSTQIGSVSSTSITGTITADKISSVNASSLVGLLTASQISTVNASSMVGVLTSSQIGSVSAGSIVGQISAGSIGSVSASSITGVIVSEQLASQILNSVSMINPNILSGGIVVDGTTISLSSDDTSNMLRNSSFEFDQDIVGKDWIYSTEQHLDGTRCIKATGSDAHVIHNWIPAKPGEAFQISVWAKSSPTTTGYMQTFCQFVDANFNYIGDGGSWGSLNATTTWSKCSNTLSVAPPGTAWVVPYICWTGNSSAGSVWYLDSAFMKRGIDATLIQSVNASTIQGSITAAQIGSVNTSSLVGLITAGQIQNINATQISGTIQASQIGSISYSNISSVNAATITIGQIQDSQIANVAVGKLLAGTITAAVSMTSPSLTCTGSSFVAVLNNTDGLKVTSNSNNSYSQLNTGTLRILGINTNATFSADISSKSIQVGSSTYNYGCSMTVDSTGAYLECGAQLTGNYWTIQGASGSTRIFTSASGAYINLSGSGTYIASLGGFRVGVNTVIDANRNATFATLTVGGNLQFGNIQTSANTTPSTFTNWVAIYDTSGTYRGKFPLY